MKNIEVYEFFNFSSQKKADKVFKVLHSSANGLVVETDHLEDCYHILSELKEILDTKPDFDSSVILFFKDGRSVGGFEEGTAVATNSRPSRIEENIIKFLEENYNIYL